MIEEIKQYEPPALEKCIEDFKKWPSSGINRDIFKEGIESGKITPEQQMELNDTFIAGYNKALYSCFPKDAFCLLEEYNMMADNIPPQEHLDLDKEWEEITKLIKLNEKQENITTNFAFKHFLRTNKEDYPDYEAMCKRFSLYISECIRRAHQENDYNLLEKVIPTFKLLAYFHKLHEQGHYNCESEYDAMVHFGTDPDRLEFKFLHDDELTEDLYNKADLIKK